MTSRRLLTAALLVGALSAVAMTTMQVALLVLPLVPLPLVLAWTDAPRSLRLTAAAGAVITAAALGSGLTLAGGSAAGGALLAALIGLWAAASVAPALASAALPASRIAGRFAVSGAIAATLPVLIAAGAALLSGSRWPNQLVVTLEDELARRQAACDGLSSGQAEWALRSCGSIDQLADAARWVESHAVTVAVAALVVGLVTVGVTAGALSRWLLARRVEHVTSLPRFRDFALHWSLNYVVAAGVLFVAVAAVLDGTTAGLMNGIGAGMLICVGGGFVAQGAALVSWMFRRAGRGRLMRTVFWVLAVLFYVISVPMLSALGLFEQLSRLRERADAANPT